MTETALPDSLMSRLQTAASSGLGLGPLSAMLYDSYSEHASPAALLGPDLVYAAANPAYAQLFRLAPSALVGKPHAVLEQGEHDLPLMRQAVDFGEHVEFPIFGGQNSGSAERYATWSLTPLAPPGGNVVALLVEYSKNPPGVPRHPDPKGGGQ